MSDIYIYICKTPTFSVSTVYQTLQYFDCMGVKLLGQEHLKEVSEIMAQYNWNIWFQTLYVFFKILNDSNLRPSVLAQQ